MAAVLLLAACAPAPSPAPPPPDAAAVANPEPTAPAPVPRWRKTAGVQGTGQSSGPIVRLGAALSLSGPASLVGVAQRNGIKLAQDEINASKMLGSTRLEVIVEDDASNRQVASGVFHKFIANSRVLGILGPTLSDTALTVDPIAHQAGVPVLAVSNAAGGITQIGDFIFRASLSDAQVIPPTVRLVKSRLGLQSAALLHADTDTSRGAAHSFKKSLHVAKVPLTSEQTFSMGDTDFSAQLAEIASTNPQALFVAAPPPSAAEILIQARRYGLENLPIVGSSGFNSSMVLRAAGDAAEGLIVGSAWSAANPEARNQQFIQAYRNRHGSDPDQFAAQAYAGVYIMAAAIREADTVTNPGAVRDALTRMQKLDTPMGPFSFNAARDADYPPLVQVVKNGRFELY